MSKTRDLEETISDIEWELENKEGDHWKEAFDEAKGEILNVFDCANPDFDFSYETLSSIAEDNENLIAEEARKILEEKIEDLEKKLEDLERYSKRESTR